MVENELSAIIPNAKRIGQAYRNKSPIAGCRFI
jgi:hypothetical protein